MAARFAVTTGNWSGAIWAATSGGAAGSAAVPTSADDVTINKNVTVTVTDTAAVANSVALSIGTTSGDVGAILTCTTSANWQLSIELGLSATKTSTASYMASILFDMSASTFSGVVKFRNAATASTFALDGNYVIKGSYRKRHTTIDLALTKNVSLGAEITDATGWKVGDLLVFGSTEVGLGTGVGCSVVSIATITFDNAPTNTGAATVTWTDGLGTGGTCQYSHVVGTPVGNFSSNMEVSATTEQTVSAVVSITSLAGQQSMDCYLEHVTMKGLVAAGNSSGGLTYNLGSQADNTAARHKSISHNTFYNGRGQAFYINYMSALTRRAFNVFYTSYSASGDGTYLIANTPGVFPALDEEDLCVLRASNGPGMGYSGMRLIRAKVSNNFTITSAGDLVGVTRYAEDCLFWKWQEEPSFARKTRLMRCRFGDKAFPNGDGPASTTIVLSVNAEVVAVDCHFNSTGMTFNGIGPNNPVSFLMQNKNADPAVQELYQYQSTTIPAIQRNAVTTSRSTSAMEFTLNSTTAQEWPVEVLAKAGAALKIVGLFRKDAAYGASTLPKVTLSGLGITPVVATMSAGTAADAWETYTLDLAAEDAPATDGLLTLTFTAQSANANAKAFFAGVPAAPFVSRCRHYGYVFDETNPVRVGNQTIGVGEATAAAYTGMAVMWGASSSSVTVTTSNTLQKLYDYTQAQGCLNVGMAMPLTGAGVAGSPALFAAGNITVADGAVLNGSGSLSMGSKTLSTEFASGVNYTFTGGTWGQLSNSPTFAGGTLSIGAAATYAFATTGAIIINMTPTAPSTYAMASVTATGQIDLRNTTAHAITVELSSAAAALAITTNNTGGAITIRAPQVYQQVPITNITTTSRLQIYDISAVAPAGSRELYNGVPGATSYTWTDPLPAVAARDIRVRIADVTGVTAKEFIESSIGTCGITEGTKSVSYRASQVADTTYNTNAVNGSLVTGITFTDAATDLVNVNLTGGNTTWPNIYAAFAYWISTAAGIDDDIAYVDAVDPANYLLTSMKVKNTTSPSVPLTITGGFGRSATTGSIVDIIDTTGGFIFPLVDHVVVATVGSGPLTATQDAKLMGLPSATTTASATLAAAETTPIAANIKQVNSLAVDGAGTESDPWGPV